jgi:hypothetical protein
MRMIIAAAALISAISITAAQPSIHLVGDTNCGMWIEGRTQRTALALEQLCPRVFKRNGKRIGH